MQPRLGQWRQHLLQQGADLYGEGMGGIDHPARAKLLQQVDYLKMQVDLIEEEVAKLTVKSPIAGRVMTWDAKRQLQNRPVERGQVLMTIAADDTEYEVELFMPERRIGHLQRELDRIQAADPTKSLEVDFISKIDPGLKHKGHVAHVNPTAESHEEHGNMIRIRVTLDDEIHNPKPGSEVSANVHCGRAPWLWCKLHEAWEWLEVTWFGI